MTNDDIARLRALVAEFREHGFERILVAATDVDALLDELEKARADAERYRWLRDKADSAAYAAPMACMVGYKPFNMGELLSGHRLDAAIDQARAAQETQG